MRRGWRFIALLCGIGAVAVAVGAIGMAAWGTAPEMADVARLIIGLTCAALVARRIGGR
ncbi:hypothetical protein [Rhodovarius crocodyli]|uniref:hypothetical protein n=1 Tax=Rhodovarius crocodyli TaxID=1979269 RepID=UPI0013E34E99|nr:hypothetical protein [Rhodovarius crocodyli]